MLVTFFCLLMTFQSVTNITFWHIMMLLNDWNVTNMQKNVTYILFRHQNHKMVTVIKSPTYRCHQHHCHPFEAGSFCSTFYLNSETNAYQATWNFHGGSRLFQIDLVQIHYRSRNPNFIIHLDHCWAVIKYHCFPGFYREKLSDTFERISFHLNLPTPSLSYKLL